MLPHHLDYTRTHRGQFISQEFEWKRCSAMQLTPCMCLMFVLDIGFINLLKVRGEGVMLCSGVIICY